MATDRQRAANRANSQQSTGPRTDAGKARSARNRRVHGLTSAQALLPGEDPAPFENLKALLHDEWMPATETECQLVDDLALQQWKLRRAESMEVAALARSMEDGQAEAAVPKLTDEAARTARYVASIRRAWMNALTRLRQLQAERREREAAQPPDSLVDDMADFLRDETNPISPMSLPPQPVAPPSLPPAPAPPNPADPAPSEPQ